MIPCIILQLLTERHKPRHHIRRRRILLTIVAMRSIFQIVLIGIERSLCAPCGILMSYHSYSLSYRGTPAAFRVMA